MMAIICQAHTDISPLPTVNDVTSRWLVCATAWFIGWYMNIWWKFTTKFLLTMFGRAGKTKGCPARWPERNSFLKNIRAVLFGGRILLNFLITSNRTNFWKLFVVG